MNKYLYFRTEATDANDDATGDSACSKPAFSSTVWKGDLIAFNK